MRVLIHLFAILTSLTGALCKHTEPHDLVTPQVVHTFPNGTSLENLAIRASGEILCTVLSAPEIYQLDPIENSSAKLVHSFPGYTSVLGIVEMQPDQFYVVAGNVTFATFSSVQGSWSAFHVNMSEFDINGAATVTKVTDFPDALLLDGLGVLSREQGLVYVADIYAGVVSILNVNTGDHYVAINNSLTVAGPPNFTSAGVNGVHVFEEPNGTLYLYFSNTAQSLLARIPINANGTPAGEPEVVVSGIKVDDFTFDSDGNILQAVLGSNEVAKINVTTKKVTIIAGNPSSTELMSVTSAQFGRLCDDEDTLYVTMNGANFSDIALVVPGALKMLKLGPRLV
ncbi:hypothetical protein BDP27DRAFT_1271559 [Rhodocollybia butyracea]|uniref:SMP-30/Gluconolactonase/LRE-like region domain-containing protein n=1 Tax=Rhodocollybia butyracea TaxID=206335 RepID=A0A9P5PI61_9AGAR|nr:hypothetical protein BDP27DRAFT_1271559 [Rhodocollybia butyracea]